MSEEYENEVEEMGEELSAEELFEQHRLEIEQRFSEKGFFGRLIDMFVGLSKPRSSREYKIATVELQRLAAPLLAILLPTLGVIALIVITAVTGQSKEVIQVEIASAQQDQEELTEESEPEPEEIDMTQDIDVTVDVAVDMPNVTTEVMSQSESPGGEPDTVMSAPSPVTMANIKGSTKLRGLGDGDGGGFGTQIKAGKPQDLDGALIGAIIDVKTTNDPNDPKGRPLGYSGNTTKIFADRFKNCISGNFTDAACAHVRKLQKRVAMSNLFIKPQMATKGPEAFGVQDIVEPKGWAVYYVGDITPTEKARYRLWGYYDDYILVRINGKVVMEYKWPCKTVGDAGLCTGWKPEPDSEKLLGKYNSSQKFTWLAPSDWWEAKPGQKIKLEIVIAEKDGGWTGGLLCIEKEGETYPQHKGQPVFPIFSTRKLSIKDIERFESFCAGKGDAGKNQHRNGDYLIGTDNVPLFNPRKSGKSSGKSKKKANKKQVDVEVDI